MANDTIPAATVILFRDTGGGTEHLFVERAVTMAFAGGAVVFPGGRVDPNDRSLASRFGTIEPDDAAGRVAAIRETIEETGHILGFADAAAVPVERVRNGLLAGTPFSALLDAMGLTLDLGALVPFARWCPKLHQSRNFDTRFYIACAGHDQPDLRVDATENVRLFWQTAQGVLDAADRGEVQIIFPTRRNLERLAPLTNYNEAVAHATDYPPSLIEPWIERGTDGDRLCIPDDRGYPVTWELMTAAIRG